MRTVVTSSLLALTLPPLPFPFIQAYVCTATCHSNARLLKDLSIRAESRLSLPITIQTPFASVARGGYLDGRLHNYP